MLWTFLFFEYFINQIRPNGYNGFYQEINELKNTFDYLSCCKPGHKNF